MSQAKFAFIIPAEEDKQRNLREGAWNVPGAGAVFEIYLITNSVNGKKYVGQAWYGAKRRWREHKRLAAKGPETSIGLRGAIQKYGVSAFRFEIIDTADNEFELDALEIKWIAHYSTYAPDGKGYNLTEGGGGCRKWKPTEENLANITAANRKMHADPIWQAKIAAASIIRSSNTEYLDTMRKVGAEKVLSYNSIDPDGADKRAYMRASAARGRARGKGIPIPKVTPEDIIARTDARDPDGAEDRAKQRAWTKKVSVQKAERTRLGLPEDGVAARDITDPDGAAFRANCRAAANRYNARKRGEPVPIRLQKERGAANIAALDAIDPDGAPKRARQRAAKERCKARRAAGIPAKARSKVSKNSN